NTPQQALTLLNDPTFVEAARVLAARLLEAEAISDEKRLDMAFERALGRPVKDKERNSLIKFLNTQREYCAANMAESAKLMHVGIAAAPTNNPKSELAAWTEVCRVMLNLHETITKY